MKKFTKRSAVVAVPAALLGVAGVAFAANLPVVSNYLGGGSATVDTLCSFAASYSTGGANPTDVVWHNAVMDSTKSPAVVVSPAGYYVQAVTITPNSACPGGSTFRVSLTDSAGKQLSEFDGTLQQGGGSQDVTLTKAVLADTVTGVSAVVTSARS